MPTRKRTRRNWMPGQLATPTAAATAPIGNSSTATRGRKPGRTAGVQHFAAPRNLAGGTVNPQMVAFLSNYIGILTETGLLVGDPQVCFNIGARLASNA
jgi:hypothetical protein